MMAVSASRLRSLGFSYVIMYKSFVFRGGALIGWQWGSSMILIIDKFNPSEFCSQDSQGKVSNIYYFVIYYFI